MTACVLLVFTVAGLSYHRWGVHPSYGATPTYPTWGELGETLGASAVRWDSTAYVAVAESGYNELAETAWFPFYPMLMRAVGTVTGSVTIAGLLISLVAMLAGLTILYRLAELELGPAAATRSVWLMALFPTAVFLPAIWTESLFLALTVGAVYAARRNRWGIAVALGALAALTRNTGVLLVIPLVLLYLYGPRPISSLDPPPGGLWPRFPIRRDFFALAFIPLALLAFCVYCWIAWGDPLATWHAQQNWDRGFHGPLSAVWFAAQDAWQQAAHLARHGTIWSEVLTYEADAYWAVRAVREFGWIIFAAVALVGVFRRLPIAYGAYASAAVTVPLTGANPAAPLSSFSRYLLVLFPLQMWLASWASTRQRFAVVIGASIVLLIFYTFELANGRAV